VTLCRPEEKVWRFRTSPTPDGIPPLRSLDAPGNYPSHDSCLTEAVKSHTDCVEIWVQIRLPDS